MRGLEEVAVARRVVVGMSDILVAEVAGRVRVRVAEVVLRAEVERTVEVLLC